MSRSRRTSVLKVGLVTPVGLYAAAVAAALRAGISRVRLHAFDPQHEPSVPIAWLNDDVLPPLVSEAGQGLPVELHRPVRLATYALQEALADVTAPVPLLVACPDEHVPSVSAGALVSSLAAQAKVTVDVAGSRIIRRGRASAMLALHEALGWLAEGRHAQVCVGGIDSLVAPEHLRRLAAAGRLHGLESRDGFVPGEGAAFLLLGRQARTPPLAELVDVAVHDRPEPGGGGLALAIKQLYSGPIPAPQIAHTFAGLNGESKWAREWGVARIRCAEWLSERGRVDHPAEFIGDVGAATGALLVGVASVAAARQTHPSPSLAWCGSDGPERGVALIQRTARRS